MARNNGSEFHVAALLFRRGKLIRIGINSKRSRREFFRYYSNNYRDKPHSQGDSYNCHAEMDALLNYQAGDRLVVMRWINTSDKPVMAKPCEHCMLRIQRLGVKVRYTDHNGRFCSL